MEGRKGMKGEGDGMKQEGRKGEARKGRRGGNGMRVEERKKGGD